MPRIGFQLKVAPQHIDEYVRRHAEVWPEMLAEIAAAGRRNYSLFLAPDGTLFGSYDVDDEAAANAYLAASPVVARWEADMSQFFDGLEGRADQAASPLVEVFNLEEQLGA